MKRSAPIAVVAVFVVGAIVGGVLHREVTKHRRPPVRVTLYLSLASDDFLDSPDMEIYAKSVAAQLEARFHRPHTSLHSFDLEVTAHPPSCFESRQGCGTEVRWGFQLRSKSAIDQDLASIAAGRGELALRAVEGADPATCGHQALVHEGASIAEPFVPRAVAGAKCLRMGPVIRNLVGATAVEHTTYSRTRPSTVNVTLSSADGRGLGGWSRTHGGAEVAVTLDGWIIGRVRAEAIADLSRAAAAAQQAGITRPIELRSIGLHQPMDAAIAIAINAAAAPKPLFEDPSTSP